MNISIIGSGTMGIGIAHLTAQKNYKIILYDYSAKALKRGKNNLLDLLEKLVKKGKYTKKESNKIINNIIFTENLNKVKKSNLVIEAIIEDLKMKQEVFSKIEELVTPDCILASNTSSLSISSIASACKISSRVIGMHFFNPANLMPLVEIIPSVQTSKDTIEKTKKILLGMDKTIVLAKDTPGFIVNRVARPFYGESLRIYEEGIANFETIDWALKEIGGFKMGPFELMDYIGNDINYTVTQTVFKEFYYDPRYKPSFTQKRLMEAGYLGRKSGRGYYDYTNEISKEINQNRKLAKSIVLRVLSMLINEAADALFLKIASKKDIDLAMTKGVNYPKGLLKWADEIGIPNILKILEDLYSTYCEDRYRPSPILRKMSEENKTFY